ncbi:MAG: Ldh family oxidoreductase [Pseudomonadota bacterium]
MVAAATVLEAMEHVDAGAMEGLLEAIMKGGGCTDTEAAETARHLVGANLSGHDSHGIVRIVRYHSWLRDGTLNPGRPLDPVLDTSTLIQFDGQRGIGQHLCFEATRVGIERAREHGSAIVALRRAGHIGRLGHYAEHAAAEGLVSVQFCNVARSQIVAPFGAAERTMSTNPVAIGIPHGEGGGDPFILDFATAYVAEGKALVAATGGKPLPSDALVTADGRITSDPDALYGPSATTPLPDPSQGSGALRTMGEHKGSGLALACELLAGALTGNGTNASDRVFGNGWLAIFLDPGRLDDTSGFATEVAAYVAKVRGARPAAGVDKVKIPGDVERATKAARLAEGIPLSSRLLDAIFGVAEELQLGTRRADVLFKGK